MPHLIYRTFEKTFSVQSCRQLGAVRVLPATRGVTAAGCDPAGGVHASDTSTPLSPPLSRHGVHLEPRRCAGVRRHRQPCRRHAGAQPWLLELLLSRAEAAGHTLVTVVTVIGRAAALFAAARDAAMTAGNLTSTASRDFFPGAVGANPAATTFLPHTFTST